MKTNPWDSANCILNVSRELVNGVSQITRATGAYTDGLAHMQFNLIQPTPRVQKVGQHTACAPDDNYNSTCLKQEGTNAEASKVLKGRNGKAGSNKEATIIYDLRGRATTRSSQTGHILKWTDSSGKERDIYADIRLKYPIDEDVIKKSIANAFTALCSKYANIIRQDRADAQLGTLTLLQALGLHGRTYLGRVCHIKPEYIDRRYKAMARIAVKLESYSLDGIPQSAIDAIRQELGRTADDGLLNIWKFIEYLRTTGKHHSPNPLTKYYSSHPHRIPKQADELQRELEKPESLPASVRLAFRDGIANADVGNGKVSGSILVSEGFGASAACNILWGDLVFDQIMGFTGTCQVKVNLNERAGATHDYLHPCSPFAAVELHRRYIALQKLDPDLDCKRVVGDTTPAQLTAHCRNCLHHLNYTLGPKMDRQGGKGQEGGGVKLLRLDYYFRLRYVCGIRTPGMLRYLRMLAFGTDTTSDNYRSFSCPRGQQALWKKLRHDIWPTEEPARPPKPDVTQADGKTTIALGPGHPERTTELTMRVKLRAGDTLEVWSEEGLRGTAVIRGDGHRHRKSKTP